MNVGRVEIVPLLDVVAASGRPSVELNYPGGHPETWILARERHPEVFDGDRWRLHVRCVALRSGGRTILVDTGVGPASAPAFAWSGVPGRLPEELAAAGLAVADVDTVVLTHIHDDHLGWAVAEGTADPTFPNARYLLHPADWSLMASTEDPEDAEVFRRFLAPLERAGVLELTADVVALDDDLTIVHAPGHTPGHQVVLVDSGPERAIVAGDLVNHPAQLIQPGLAGTSDGDPALAAATRSAFVERIVREDRLVLPAHFAEASGRIVRDGDGRRWVAGEA